MNIPGDARTTMGDSSAKRTQHAAVREGEAGGVQSHPQLTSVSRQSQEYMDEPKYPQAVKSPVGETHEPSKDHDENDDQESGFGSFSEAAGPSAAVHEDEQVSVQPRNRTSQP